MVYNKDYCIVLYFSYKSTMKGCPWRDNSDNTLALETSVVMDI